MANLPKGITQRPDGRYSIRVMRDGQKVQKYAKTRKEAESILREITYELEHGTFVKDTKLTVDKWFNTWVETYKRPTIKASTIAIYQNQYNVHVLCIQMHNPCMRSLCQGNSSTACISDEEQSYPGLDSRFESPQDNTESIFHPLR